MADSYTKLARILYLAKNAPGMVPNEIAVLSKYKIDIDDPKKAMRQVAELLGKTPGGLLRSGIGETLGQNESSIRFMSIGIEKITDLLEKLQRAGQAQSKDALDQAEAQVSALGRLENAWARVKNAIGVKVSPVMEWVADAVTGESPKGGRGPAATGGMQSASEGMDYFMRGAGIVGEMYKPAVPASGPPLAQGSSELARMLQEDLKNGAQFNSPAAMNKVLGENPAIQLEVTFANAPPDTTIRARAGGQQVPVRISNTAPAGSTP